jgi:hypothetical protein
MRWALAEMAKPPSGGGASWFNPAIAQRGVRVFSENQPRFGDLDVVYSQ